jgi:hypothetical protein
MPTTFALFLGLGFGVAVGCGDDPATSTSVCHVGDTRACLGPGACDGAQECMADGSGFKACECGGNMQHSGGSGGEGPDPGNTGDAGSSMTTKGGMPGVDTGGMPGAAGGDDPPIVIGGGGAPEGGAGGAAPDLECHPVGKVGCLKLQNCSPDGDLPTCVDAGTKQELELCDQTSDCALGLICQFNNCVKPCATTEDCGSADPNIKCGLGRVFDNGLGVVGSCVKRCDVVEQDCDAGLACYLGSCLTSVLQKADDTPCESSTDCAKGLDCLSTGYCSAYCDTGAQQDTCTKGRSCYALSEQFPNLPAAWGLCVEQ